MTCADMFLHHPIAVKLSTVASQNSYSTHFTSQSADTLQFIGQSPGQFDLIYQVKPKKSSWESLENGPDLQGDPRWAIAVLGTHTAADFGFRMLDVNTMEIPSAIEFIGRYEQWQKKLPVTNSVNFYLAKKIISADNYLSNFEKNGAIPLGTKGRLYVHDLVWHTLSPLLIPPRFFEFIRGRARLILKYEKWLRKVHPEAQRNQLEAGKNELSTTIDLLLGNPIYFFTEKMKSGDLASNGADYANNYLSLILRKELSPGNPAQFLSKHDYRNRLLIKEFIAQSDFAKVPEIYNLDTGSKFLEKMQDAILQIQTATLSAGDVR